MRSALLTCALACVAVSAAADGEEDLPPDEETAENLQPVTWKYTAHVTNPESLLATPEAACAQWAAFQATKGYHHTFVKVLPSTEAGYEGSFDCVFKNKDWNNEQWTQSHGAEDVPTCPVTSEVISLDNSGTDASQRCRCTDVSQCATTPAAPAEDAKPPAEPPAPDAVPEYPFAPDKSKRCKQQKHKRRANARTAARTSAANRQAVQDDPEHAKWRPATTRCSIASSAASVRSSRPATATRRPRSPTSRGARATTAA